MQVYFHSEYRQFTRLRQPGETVNVRDNVGNMLIARNQACPVVDGGHQCRQAPPSASQFRPTSPTVGVADAPGYLDEMQDNDVDEMMLPVRWSHSNRTKMRNASKRSLRVRRVLIGQNFQDIQPGMLN